MTRPRSFFVVVAVASALIAGCSTDSTDSWAASTTEAVASPELVGVDDFAAAIDDPDVVTVNVHTPDEGDLPGTDLSIPFDEIEGADNLPADLNTPLAVYCRSGNMSADAVKDLDSMGYTNVVELEGGFNAWVDEGRQLLDPTP